MSNYPPGVSGNEPEIAGYPEGRMVLACDHDTVDMVASDWVVQEIRAIAGLARRVDVAKTAALLEALAAKILDEDGTVDTECGFEGLVDVVIVDGYAQWTCPRCGQDVESELDDGVDPDAGRD